MIASRVWHQDVTPFVGTYPTPEHSLAPDFGFTNNFSLGQHSALREFFEPSRSNDPRADSFAAYRKKADELDRNYAKLDEDLDTSLIFVSESIRTRSFNADSGSAQEDFLSAIDSASEPESTSNGTTAAYMQIPIHAPRSNGSAGRLGFVRFHCVLSATHDLTTPRLANCHGTRVGVYTQTERPRWYHDSMSPPPPTL